MMAYKKPAVINAATVHSVLPAAALVSAVAKAAAIVASFSVAEAAAVGAASGIAVGAAKGDNKINPFYTRALNKRKVSV